MTRRLATLAVLVGLAACAAPAEPHAIEDAAPTPAVDGGADAGPVCTSGVLVDPNHEEGPKMLPGRACISCHADENASSGDADAPIFAFAGTVYSTLHEPDLCAGERAAGAEIVITDALGQVFVAPVNEVGNFHSGDEVALTLPFRAKLRFEGRERAMLHAQSDGDCNSCHSSEGTAGAPGRIFLP